jgi:hypothetical protein
MPASIDFDRSGVSVQSSRVNLGPSLGWVDVLGGGIDITAPTTIAIPLGISEVNVNVAGAVVIELPSAKGNPAGAMAVPNSYAISPIIIRDVGGFAQAHPITITAATGETISGLTSITIATNYATTVLMPDITSGQWTAI